jgi:hypothetical protein
MDKLSQIHLKKRIHVFEWFFFYYTCLYTYYPFVEHGAVVAIVS